MAAEMKDASTGDSFTNSSLATGLEACERASASVIIPGGRSLTATRDGTTVSSEASSEGSVDKSPCEGATKSSSLTEDGAGEAESETEGASQRGRLTPVVCPTSAGSAMEVGGITGARLDLGA